MCVSLIWRLTSQLKLTYYTVWTGVLGMSAETVQVFLVDVRKDVMNRSIHSYWPVSVNISYEMSITDIFLGTPYMDANLQQ
jgi:hypothetical protein